MSEDQLAMLKTFMPIINRYLLEFPKEQNSELHFQYERARAAIAKAEGKSAKAEWGDPTLTEDQATEMLRKEREES